jgi:hypothetical protein
MQDIILNRQAPHALSRQLSHSTGINLGSGAIQRPMPLPMRQRITQLDERNKLLSYKSIYLSVSGLCRERETSRNLADRDIVTTSESLLNDSLPLICHSRSTVDPLTLIRREAGWLMNYTKERGLKLSGWPRNFVGGQSSGSCPRPAR